MDKDDYLQFLNDDDDWFEAEQYLLENSPTFVDIFSKNNTNIAAVYPELHILQHLRKPKQINKQTRPRSNGNIRRLEVPNNRKHRHRRAQVTCSK